MIQPRRVLIIGSSIAGVSAAEAARQQDPSAEVTIVSRDEYPPYYRLRLCEIIDSPDVADALFLHPPAWYEERRIRLALNATVVRIDPAARSVELADGTSMLYDALILTTGSQSFVPPIPGVERPGVQTLWTMADALSIEQSLRSVRKAVVIGGGLLGLEGAYHIRRKGIATTIIEKMPRLLANQLDEGGSAVFESQISHLDIEIICDADIVAIDSADASRSDAGATDASASDSARGSDTDSAPGQAGAHALRVRMADGSAVEADFVMISIGVRANVDLARAAGLAINRRIITDDAMRTSSPDIYAAGDAAEPGGAYWFGLWSVSRSQGKVAGINAAGGDARFDRTVPPYVLNTMETHVAVQGDRGAAEPLYQLDVLMDKQSGNYRKLIYRKGVFSGFMLVGNTLDFIRLQKELAQQAPDPQKDPQQRP